MTRSRSPNVRDGLASFQALADVLSERHHIDPPLDRRRFWLWWSRGTKNAAGEHFPQPVETTYASEDGGRASRWFDIEAVNVWLINGVPGPRRKGWVFINTAARGSAKL